MNALNRRTALERIALMLGGVISAPALATVEGRKLHPNGINTFQPGQDHLLAAIADVIIPDTDTPGAKAAKAEKFIMNVVNDCYAPEEQQHFHQGLAKLEKDCQQKFGKGFEALSLQQKKEALTTCMLEADAERRNNRGKKAPAPFFFMMKELTTVGYFTSEIGATKALEYLPIPGKFDGCMPLSDKQKTWAL